MIPQLDQRVLLPARLDHAGATAIDEQWQVRQIVPGSMREVAEIGGGFLGPTSKISEAEQKVIKEPLDVLD